jgi:hypothetical protein
MYVIIAAMILVIIAAVIIVIIAAMILVIIAAVIIVIIAAMIMVIIAAMIFVLRVSPNSISSHLISPTTIVLSPFPPSLLSSPFLLSPITENYFPISDTILLQILS